MKVPEAARVSKLRENEISKGDANVSGGNGDRVDLGNINGNIGKDSKVSKKLNESGKSYVVVVNGDEMSWLGVNNETQKVNDVTENGNGDKETIEVVDNDVVLEDITNGKAESTIQSSASVSDTKTLNGNEANTKQSSYAQKLLENTNEIGN